MQPDALRAGVSRPAENSASTSLKTGHSAMLQPACAPLAFQARDVVAQGPHADDLHARLVAHDDPIDVILARGRCRPHPADVAILIPALVLGATEFQARGWRAGRRRAPPASHAGRLALAAWRSPPA